MRLDDAPLTLAAAAGRKPKGVFLIVPLRLVTEASGVRTDALGPFTLVDANGARYQGSRDFWILKWVSLNFRRLPLLGVEAKPSGFLIQTQSYRWEVKALGANRIIDSFLLYDVPAGSQGFTLEYGDRRVALAGARPAPAPVVTPTS